MSPSRIEWLLTNPLWAIVPERLLAIVAAAKSNEARSSEAADEARKNYVPRVSGSVAMLPMTGLIQQRSSWVLDFFGGTSTEAFGRAFDAAIASPDIKGVVFDVDSPGGTVYGVDELSKKIFEARGSKPIVAVSNAMAASAAYWLASSAEKLIVTPSGDVGSIGVWMAHVDWSKMEEQMGVKTTLVSAGKYKVEGNPWEPLDDEARIAMQSHVDASYSAFVSAVARNRATTAGAVRGGFGQGRLVQAKEALNEGMVDKVQSLERTLSEMGVTRKTSASGRAEDEGLSEYLLAAWNGEQQVEPEPVENCGDPDVLRRKLGLKEKMTA